MTALRAVGSTATVTDIETLSSVHNALAHRGLLPAEHFVDPGHVSSQHNSSNPNARDRRLHRCRLRQRDGAGPGTVHDRRRVDPLEAEPGDGVVDGLGPGPGNGDRVTHHRPPLPD